jgi:G protein-coupled receptor kinase-interacting protein 1 C term
LTFVQLYLEDQTDSLVHSIQSLVGSIRAEAELHQIRTHISTIANVVGQVVSATENSMPVSSSLRSQVEPIVRNLANCKSRLISASAESEGLGDKGRVREFMSKLPPLAFEIARETKELVQRVEMVDQEGAQGREDYS